MLSLKLKKFVGPYQTKLTNLDVGDILKTLPN